MFNRRGFLQTLAVSALALAFDPERLLWTPGAKTIFIPPASSLIVVTARHSPLLRKYMLGLDGQWIDITHF